MRAALEKHKAIVNTKLCEIHTAETTFSSPRGWAAEGVEI